MQSNVPGADTGPSALPGDILIVEDDPLLALDFSDTLTSIGVASVRRAARSQDALAMIAEHAPDFAVLNVALVRETSFAVAEQLDELGIPFVFVTGYVAPKTFPAKFVTRPVLIKPYRHELLLEFVANWRDMTKAARQD